MITGDIVITGERGDTVHCWMRYRTYDHLLCALLHGKVVCSCMCIHRWRATEEGGTLETRDIGGWGWQSGGVRGGTTDTVCRSLG